MSTKRQFKDLSLKKETIRELTPDEVQQVIGGARKPEQPTCNMTCRVSCAVTGCDTTCHVTCEVTGY